MPTFLIATDFSAASRNATQYGIELARAFNARVILVSAYQQVPVALTDSLVVITPAERCELVKQQREGEADFSDMFACPQGSWKSPSAQPSF